MNAKHARTILKPLLLATLVCVVALVGHVSLQTTQGQSVDSTANKIPPNSITGRVVTPTGEPITNATVFVSRLNAPGPARPSPSGADGSFVISGLESGVFNVSASAPSYIPLDVESSSKEYHRVGDSVTVMMIKGGIINGKVRDADGQPVVAVRVRALMVRDADGQPGAGTASIERATDDRGIYRLYGLQPGTYVVSAGGDFGGGPSGGAGGRGAGGFGAGGRGGFGGGGFGGGGLGAGAANAVYSRDAPTFAPSSARDTAEEIAVAAGVEVNDVDIEYRGERGHAVSGTVKASGVVKGGYSFSTVTLSLAKHEGETVSATVARGSAFAFYGVADGEYELEAQTPNGAGGASVSLPVHISVNGANVSGVVLNTNPLASISGRVAFEPSAAPECKNKPQPRLEEILIGARREVKRESKEPHLPARFASATSAPANNGSFVLDKLEPGQYRLSANFFAKDWYLRAMTLPSTTAVAAPRAPVKVQPANQPAATRGTDVIRDGLPLKFGSRVTGLTVALTEGAGTLHGHVVVAEGEKPAPGLFVYLIPAEKDQGDNALRFFATAVGGDGSFTIGNVPPGLYWMLTRTASGRASQVESKLRANDGREERASLRRDGEQAKTSVELRPCQEVIDYQLPLIAARN